MGTVWEALSNATMKMYLKQVAKGFLYRRIGQDLPCGRLQVAARKAGLK